MVVIRLQRAGARNRPFFRIVVADSRRARDGRFIEKVGYYDPVPRQDVISLDHPRVEEWIRQGARPSTSVAQLIKRSRMRISSGTSGLPAPDAERVSPAAAEADPGAPVSE